MPVLRPRVVLREFRALSDLDHRGLGLRHGRHCGQQYRSRPDHERESVWCLRRERVQCRHLFLRHHIRRGLLGLAHWLGDHAIRRQQRPLLRYGPGGRRRARQPYTNLVTSVKRGIVTGLITAKITDSINMNLDLNWGKVDAFNPLSNFQIQDGSLLGFDNPYLQAVSGKTGPVLAAASRCGCSHRPVRNLRRCSRLCC